MLFGVFRISVNEVKTLDKKKFLEINFCLISQGVYDEKNTKKIQTKLNWWTNCWDFKKHMYFYTIQPQSLNFKHESFSACCNGNGEWSHGTFIFSGGGQLVVKTHAVFCDLLRTKSIEETLN